MLNTSMMSMGRPASEDDDPEAIRWTRANSWKIKTEVVLTKQVQASDYEGQGQDTALLEAVLLWLKRNKPLTHKNHFSQSVGLIPTTAL